MASKASSCSGGRASASSAPSTASSSTRPVMPFCTAAWSSWSSTARTSLSGCHAGEERHRLALEQAEGGRHARLAEGLHEQRLERLEQLGRGRQVGAQHEHPALEGGRDPHDGVEQLAGLRVGRAPQHQHAGHLQGAVERLLEVAGVDLDDQAARARRAGGRCGAPGTVPAGIPDPAVAAVGVVIPATEDRSTAPRVPAGGVVSLMVPILSKG